MKKQLIISTALIAITTPMIAVTNVETKVESNETELNIQVKDVTENLNRARNSLIDHSSEPHNPWLWSYKFENIIIIVPNIETIYLDNKELSHDPDNYHDDDRYQIGLKMDIELEHSFKWDIGTKDNTIITNKMNVPLYLDVNNNSGRLEWKTYQSSIGINEVPSHSDWVYDISSAGNYLMNDYDFAGSSYSTIETLAESYMKMIRPFIVNGSITWSENGAPSTEYTETWEVTKNSNNEISVFGQRYYSQYSNPSNESLFGYEHLIEKDSFKTKIITNEIPGLSGGAIAGIAIGSLVGAVLIAGGGYLLYTKKISWKKSIKVSSK